MSPPRLVVDSNVIISAVFFGGPPARVLQQVIGGAAAAFISLEILDEIREVVQRPKFGLTPEQALLLIEELTHVCHVVEPKTAVQEIKDDPDDNAVLACALEAGAALIVTGDAHLLNLKEWKGIRILAPAEALNEMD